MGKTSKKLFDQLLGSGKEETRLPARAEQPIDEEMLLATRGKSVDLVFVIDTTGSMSDKIKGLLQTCAKFVDRFSRLQMDSRIAIVAFGDLTVRSDKIVATGFTNNIQTTKTSLQKIPRFSGGGNRGESSLEALQKAMALGFRNGVVKVLILITDEPALQNRNVQVGDVIEDLRGGEYLTFVVSPPEKYYKDMASRTGGKWYKVSANTDFTDLLEMFGDIASRVSDTVADVYRLGDGKVSNYLRLNAPEK
ncbi:MAG TPA: vWA domain-containing protein [Anaerolineae bacterium]|nr:vWA domain-containing protein [Anaerolineae bacterium]